MGSDWKVTLIKPLLKGQDSSLQTVANFIHGQAGKLKNPKSKLSWRAVWEKATCESRPDVSHQPASNQATSTSGTQLCWLLSSSGFPRQQTNGRFPGKLKGHSSASIFLTFTSSSLSVVELQLSHKVSLGSLPSRWWPNPNFLSYSKISVSLPITLWDP